ncbi:MarR family winged helix-turn-helix transcriptional regulator [Marinicella meishanensis]|uniref:MarR family winged helix-turn-helix transcriptional regulator n=1 Tax=Marinicella meishanensis TaxID=2873263 RepID=UPI001CC1B06F|nr:MarR family transcriptional regulator [Marinicella sp. NBU2979]
MNQELNVWLERLTSLYKSQMRQAASSAGLQMVHLEVMQYLSVCNGYSNTAQALSEYLGQTKGSISQTLKVMEQLGLVTKSNCTRDKRIVRLALTKLARAQLTAVAEQLVVVDHNHEQLTAGIRNLLKGWQQHHEQPGFGLCQSCRYHQPMDEKQFLCQLTKETLSTTGQLQLCREHEF